MARTPPAAAAGPTSSPPRPLPRAAPSGRALAPAENPSRGRELLGDQVLRFKGVTRLKIVMLEKKIRTYDVWWILVVQYDFDGDFLFLSLLIEGPMQPIHPSLLDRFGLLAEHASSSWQTCSSGRPSGKVSKSFLLSSALKRAMSKSFSCYIYIYMLS